MLSNFPHSSTGLPGLDQVLQNLTAGDNVVWKVDSIEDYQAFVEPFSRNAHQKGQKITYFRFASHPPLLPEGIGADIRWLNPEEGFETFITGVHETIAANGEGGFYVFDTLSELARDIYSDRMVGNFFMLTCPLLFKIKAIAYFAVLRYYHSIHAAGPISETTQLLLETYRHKGKLYVHPLKVEGRFSPTIYRLHVWEGDSFIPVTNSAAVSEVLNSIPRQGLESALYQIGVWNRAFVEADEVLKAQSRGENAPGKVDEMFHRLLRMSVTREERFTRMAEHYLTLEDLMKIRERMIGSGFIGGKTVGMLLARKILVTEDPAWVDKLESHDSYYIGSVIFYTYLVLNDCWWIRKQQKNPDRFLENVDEVQKRIMAGQFPDYMIERFKAMLEYFGQSPIIVRSSSLLEDNFGHQFAGKYESVFCANQGSPEERLACFLNAVRIIYASSMSEKALSYRATRGILHLDEQMALLVQRVSGAYHGDLYFPHIAGTGYSYNPFVWHPSIDPTAGVVRLVFGLGTRAVDRSDDDYTRLAALNRPEIRPEGTPDEIRRYSQRKVDVLDLKANRKITELFSELIEKIPDIPVQLFISHDDYMRIITKHGSDFTPIALSFKEIFTQTKLLADLREMMRILQKAYEHPVDIEFTVNFFEKDAYKIDLLQCRPFRPRGDNKIQLNPAEIAEKQTVIHACGAVIGPSCQTKVDRIIYIVPSIYGHMPINERYSVARTIGRLTRLPETNKPKVTLLLGPGRWGTTTPSLGVPVSFAEIAGVSILGEIVSMREDLVPDVSLGTHFFSDLVEMNIHYFALFPDKAGNTVNEEFLLSCPNRIGELLPEAQKFNSVLHVVDFPPGDNGTRLHFLADTLDQQAYGYIED